MGDIGSGGGFFTREFSREVGSKGQVYAIDTHQKSLDYIEDDIQKEGIENVQTILANPDRIKLPEKKEWTSSSCETCSTTSLTILNISRTSRVP